MSAVADFYPDIARDGFVPIEDAKPLPPNVTTHTRTYDSVSVQCISVDDAGGLLRRRDVSSFLDAYAESLDLPWAFVSTAARAAPVARTAGRAVLVRIGEIDASVIVWPCGGWWPL